MWGHAEDREPDAASLRIVGGCSRPRPSTQASVASRGPAPSRTWLGRAGRAPRCSRYSVYHQRGRRRCPDPRSARSPAGSTLSTTPSPSICGPVSHARAARTAARLRSAGGGGDEPPRRGGLALVASTLQLCRWRLSDAGVRPAATTGAARKRPPPSAHSAKQPR